MIAIKNDEISKLLSRLRKEGEERREERESLQGEITMLREKLYVVEREN
jgi:hypothetical protein